MGNDRRNIVDSTLDSIRRRKGTITPIEGADIEERFAIGIGNVPLCLQMIFAADVIPLNHLVHLHGPADSLKTSMTLAMAAMFINQGGVVRWVDTEHGFPIDIAKSLIGEEIFEKDSEQAWQFQYYPCTNSEQTQGALDQSIQEVRQMNEDIAEENRTRDPENRLKPVCGLVALDSVGASVSPKEKEHMRNKNYGKQQMAPYARTWRKPLAHYKDEIVDSNISLVLINHEREDPSPYGARQLPGGTIINYLSTLRIRTKPYRSPDENVGDSAGETIKPISVECKKNSGGEAEREIEVLKFHWINNKDFWFDWDWSSVYWLRSKLSSRKQLGPLKKIRMSNQTFTIKKIDLDSDDSDLVQYITGKDMSGKEVMDKIENCEEIIGAIKEEFSIAERPKFTERNPEGEGE